MAPITGQQDGRPSKSRRESARSVPAIINANRNDGKKLPGAFCETESDDQQDPAEKHRRQAGACTKPVLRLQPARGFGANMVTTRSATASRTGQSAHKSATANARVGHCREARRSFGDIQAESNGRPGNPRSYFRKVMARTEPRI